MLVKKKELLMYMRIKINKKEDTYLNKIRHMQSIQFLDKMLIL